MAKGKGKWIIAIIILAIVGYFLYSASSPSYPDVLTPKPDFGNADSPIKIVEYSDLQCPACGAAHPTVTQLLEEYGDDVSFKYFHFPLRSIHPYAQKAAEAAECANDQGMMKEYVDIAFNNQKALTRSDLKSYAKILGLEESFDACLDSGAKTALVDADFRSGQARGVDSTPTFYINDVKVTDRSFEAMSAQIESMLG